jgi:hypothetical protein
MTHFKGLKKHLKNGFDKIEEAYLLLGTLNKTRAFLLSIEAKLASQST